MTATSLRFAWIHNNAYDTLAIVRDNKVVSAWTVTSEVAEDYVRDGYAIEDWDLNYPDCDTIEDYGTEVTGADLNVRLQFFGAL